MIVLPHFVGFWNIIPMKIKVADYDDPVNMGFRSLCMI